MKRRKRPKRDSGTRSRISKGPARNEAHLARVRTEPCLILVHSERLPNCGGSVQAHHVRAFRLRTMGKLPSDYLTVPLCYSHHQGYRLDSAHGDIGEEAFWRFHKIDPAAWIAAFSEQGRKAIEELRGAS